MKIKYLVVLGIIGICAMITIPNAVAEITRDKSAIEGVDYKVFVYGENPDNILKGTIADYEVSGYPSTQILIKNWDKLSSLEQSTIRTELISSGYIEQR